MKVSKAFIFISLFLFVFNFANGKEGSTEIRIADFGAVGDGITDDGSAIQTAFETAKNTSGKKTLLFEANKVYYIKNIASVYLFEMGSQCKNITIDGQGSQLLFDGAKRFINAEHTADIVIKNFDIEYKPLPFYEGVVIAKNSAEKYIDVKINDEYELPELGGPTGVQKENPFFGIVWFEDTYDLATRNYMIKDVGETYSGSLNNERTVRVYSDNYGYWSDIYENKTVISLPVRGIAHIAYSLVIFHYNTNVTFENVNIWSVPWFTFSIRENYGQFVFKNVNVIPKPETTRHISAWRDGFHVKSNYASILFEDCSLWGLGDNPFNISTMSSYIESVISEQSITAKQITSSMITPYNEGDIAVVFDAVKGQILGRSEVVSSSGRKPKMIHFKTPIKGMNTDCFVWNESNANPNTVLRRVKTSRKANRFQTSVTLDQCELTGLSYFQSTTHEGPIPSNVIVKNSTLKQGVGSSDFVFRTASVFKINGKIISPQNQPFTNYLFQNNKFYGGVSLRFMENVSFINNTFMDANKGLEIADSKNILAKDNTIGNTLLNAKSQVLFEDTESEESTVVEASADKTKIDLIQPFSHWQGYTADNTVFSYHSFSDDIKPTFITDAIINDKQTDCYKIVLPDTENAIKKVSLEVFPQAENKTVAFWSYLPKGASANITAIVKGTNGTATEIYNINLNGGEFKHHKIEIPANYKASEETLKVYFKALEGKTKQPLYIGQSKIGIPTSIDAQGSLNPSFFNLFNKNDQSIELTVAKTGGEFLVYNSVGRKIYSQHNIKEKAIISRQQLEDTGLMIFLYTVDGHTYRQKGMLYR